MKVSQSATSGLVLVDKPSGMTSHDVVARVRRLAGTKKVGHAGTLDPMATGLLILGVNSATKLLTFVVGEDKTYIATIRLGAATVTDDSEGDFLVTDPGLQAQAAGSLTRLIGENGRVLAEPIKSQINQFTGEIMQVPSSVSAIKVDGERAYALVRGGDTVKLKPRPVTVSRFEALGEPRVVKTEVAGEARTFIDIDVIVECSSGTYIRALARDLGETLGVGGHLTALRRTRIGGYDLTMAQALPDRDQVASLVSGPAAKPIGGLKLEPLAAAAQKRFATRQLTADEVVDIRHGKRIASQVLQVENLDRLQKNTLPPKELAAIDLDGNLVAILTAAGGAELKSLVVFADA